jgi:predicted nucleotidyltransferase
MPTATDIEQAVDLVLAAAPGSRVIVFGSHARGDARPDSDLDLLVIEPTVRARREEMARLTDVLSPLRIPVDVVVVSRRTFEEWSDTPGTLLYEAAREGLSFGEA